MSKNIERLISAERLKRHYSWWTGPMELTREDLDTIVDMQPDAAPAWIPIKTRPMDEEERIEWSERLGYDIEYEDAVIYVSQLPDDGEEVLTCDRYGTVRIDTFSNDPDYGCCFEENGDMDGIVAWMPKPEPYKGGE